MVSVRVRWVDQMRFFDDDVAEICGVIIVPFAAGREIMSTTYPKK